MRIKKNKGGMVEVEMTPMIDIVFQLIAFFMVVTNFENLKADERVKLPDHTLAKPPKVKREKELLLNVGYLRNEQGAKINPNALLFAAGDEVPVLQSGPVLKREADLFRDLGTDPKNVTVVIRADREVPTGEVQELIKLCQENQFQKFALKAQQERGP